MKKHMLIKAVSLLLLVLILLSFGACSKSQPKVKSQSSTTSAPSTTVKEEPSSTQQVTEAEPTTKVAAATEVVERSNEEESQEDEDEDSDEEPAPSYDSYVGLWSNKDDILSGSMTVKFLSFDGNTAHFTLGANSRNAARIATTDEIVADVEDDRIEFTYEDSFDNKGEGTITLDGNSIHLSAEITEMSNGGYGISGETDMHKIN